MMSTTELPDRLYTAEQTRELDRLAGEAGLVGEELMTRAGRAAFQLMVQRWPEVTRPAILCGGGNNGGDGYVLARLARQAGLEPVIYQDRPSERLNGAARIMAQQALEAGVPVHPLTADSLPGEEPLLIDALLGTGLTGPLREDKKALIEALNGLGKPVLAVDIPSGLSADSGASTGAVLQASCTLAFIGVNRGLLTGAGPASSGELYFAGLGVSQSTFARIERSLWRPTRADYRHWLAPRRADAHKGDHGHVLVIGGERGFGGAALMAARAAARCGAGLVTLATRGEHLTAALTAQPEIMVRAVDGSQQLQPLLDRATIIAIGPGLGTGSWGRDLLAAALSGGQPLVVDADALNLIAGQEVGARDDWILTPHPGEAARLLDSSTGAIQSDRFAAVERLASRYGGTALLKGAGTLVRGDGRGALISDGNPGMASGGMGDVLTGVIAALCAQGLPPFRAAALGALAHARAADASAARDGMSGLLATDLLPFLRRELNGKTYD